MRVLLVEDDRLLGSGLRTGLRQDGCTVDWLQDADAAEHAIRLERFDVVVLDLGLPGRCGLSLLRDLRHDGIRVPVLILTARDTIDDRVVGLDAGADDYLIKPCDLTELAARLRALVRRDRGQASATLRMGDLLIDTSNREVQIQDRPISLSAKQYALLEALAANAGHVVSRASLHETAYGWGQEIDSNALEVHIHNLRRKLGRERIETVHGIGYRLVVPEAP